MNAPALRIVFDAAYLLAMAAWLGAILFVSFGVAPVIFRVLEAPSAAKFVRALFPRYYAWGATCGAIALPALLGVPLSFPEHRGPWVGVQALLLLVGTLAMMYCGQSLTPAINAARDAGPEEKARFERLHRRSVQLNGVVMLIGVGLLIAHAARPAPRTRGIVEPAPEERVRREVERLRRPTQPVRPDRAG